MEKERRLSLIKMLNKFLEKLEKEKSLTLVTGVFDILHPEHENFLRAAAELGDYLVVGLESDLRVKALKGDGRPVNNQEKRQVNLEELNVADLVFILPEEFSKREEHQALIEKIKPDFLAVSEHSPFLEVKKEIIESVGGQLKIVLAHNPEISSTSIINSRQNTSK